MLYRRARPSDAQFKSRLNRLEHEMTDLLHAVRLLQPTCEMRSQQQLDTTLEADTKRKPTRDVTLSRDAGSQTNLLKNWTVCNCSGETVKLHLTPQVAAECPYVSPDFSQSMQLRADEPLMRHASTGSLDYLNVEMCTQVWVYLPQSTFDFIVYG